jgi:hypothetical protein
VFYVKLKEMVKFPETNALRKDKAKQRSRDTPEKIQKQREYYKNWRSDRSEEKQMLGIWQVYEVWKHLNKQRAEG